MSKRVVFNAEDKIQVMVDEIRNEYGYATNTQVWVQAMIDFHASKFKDYLRAKSPKQKQTPEEKAQFMQDVAQARVNIARNKKIALMERLGGTLLDDDMVQWYTYWASGKDLQQLPLMSLSEDLVNNQFQGDKAKIKKYHKL